MRSATVALNSRRPRTAFGSAARIFVQEGLIKARSDEIFFFEAVPNFGKIRRSDAPPRHGVVGGRRPGWLSKTGADATVVPLATQTYRFHPLPCESPS